jgi:hypothetical protein
MTVSGQRQLALGERQRESSFNLTEAVLNSQTLLLGRNWPGSSATAHPSTCSSAAAAAKCPDPATLAAQFNGANYTSSSWTTQVRDNSGTAQNYYSATAVQSQPSWDSNGDGKLWVRGESVVSGVRRAVVTQVKARVIAIPFAQNTITAGYFGTTNSGRKTIVDTNGSTYSSNPTQPAPLAVRCSGGPPSSCLNYSASKGQVSPPVVNRNFSAPALVGQEQLNAMRGIARAGGTYYASGCPSSYSGAMVFIENANCNIQSTQVNSLSSPGMLVIGSGTLSLGGNSAYHGLIYAANLQNSSGYLVTLSGCAKVIGGVAVDGPGGVLAGSCGTNIAYAPAAFGLVRGYGNPAPVKGTWREVG